MAEIPISQLNRHIAHGQGSGAQEFLGLQQLLADRIGLDGDTHLLLKNPADIISVQMDMLRDILLADLPPQVFVNIIHDLLRDAPLADI